MAYEGDVYEYENRENMDSAGNNIVIARSRLQNTREFTIKPTMILLRSRFMSLGVHDFLISVVQQHIWKGTSHALEQHLPQNIRLHLML